MRSDTVVLMISVIRWSKTLLTSFELEFSYNVMSDKATIPALVNNVLNNWEKWNNVTVSVVTWILLHDVEGFDSSRGQHGWKRRGETVTLTWQTLTTWQNTFSLENNNYGKQKGKQWRILLGLWFSQRLYNTHLNNSIQSLVGRNDLDVGCLETTVLGGKTMQATA